MSEVEEWEWRQLNPADFPDFGAIEVHGLFAMGDLSFLVLREDPSDEDVDPDPAAEWKMWTLAREDDPIGHVYIEDFASLEYAKLSVDEGRANLLDYIRETSD